MPENDPSIVTKQESVEVLDSQGNSMPRSGLTSIFDKIEQGKAEGKTTSEILDSRTVSEGGTNPDPEQPVKEGAQKEPTNLDKALEQPKEPKEEPVKEPAKEPAKEPERKEEDVGDDELAVLPHDKPKTAKRIRALLDKIAKADAVVTETKKEAQEKAAKLQELQDQLSKVKTVDPATEEKVKQQLDELAQYRRRYELEKDPEVQSKFDSRISAADERIYGILKARGAGDALVNLIKEEGGWANFASSNRVIPLKGNSSQTASDLAQSILSELPYMEQRAIDAATIEQVQTKADRDHFFKEESRKAKVYFEEREAAQKKAMEEQLQNQKASLAEVERFNHEILKSDFLQERKIPENATPEQRAAIEEDNKWAQQIRQEHQRYYNAKTLPEILGVVKDAVLYHNERHKVARLTAELNAAKATLERFKKAGQSTARSGSIASGAGESKEPKTPKVMTLTDRLNAMEAGQNPDEQ